MNSESARPGRVRGRWVVAALFLIFFLPVAIAWLINVDPPDWLPLAKSNYGDLFRPPVPFPITHLETVEARPINPGLLLGKWTLVHVEPGACLAECDRAVFRMRQARFALGKDMQRIQRILIAKPEAARDSAQRLQSGDGTIEVVAATPAWFERASFFRPGAEIYLLDPQGYLVSSYAKDADPNGLISDLERLLKISKIG
ncbi:MAG: hypothetical protein R3174_06740 [Gammaproteobacteria bacterium]|nr:hypothetical protein [Gammaproteobacteria bacterium]